MILENVKLFWVKVLGAPRKNKFDSIEWAFDVSLSPEAKVMLVKAGFKGKIKDNDDDRGEYISLKRKGVKSDGSPAKSIQVVDGKKNPWPEDKLIGNGSLADVSVIVNEYGEGKLKKISLKPMAIQVHGYVAYNNTPFSVKEDSVTEPKAAGDSRSGDVWTDEDE